MNEIDGKLLSEWRRPLKVRSKVVRLEEKNTIEQHENVVHHNNKADRIQNIKALAKNRIVQSRCSEEFVEGICACEVFGGIKLPPPLSGNA